LYQKSVERRVGMANALYDFGRNEFARGDIKWLAAGGDTIRACLLKTTYTPDLVNHDFFDDVSTYVVGNSGNQTRADCPQITLSDPSAGVVDGGDVTLTTVPGAVGQCDYILIFRDDGADGTSQLIALYDTATGLPVTPNGGDITIQWDDGANKIFKL
jgi:hypothetical protein